MAFGGETVDNIGVIRWFPSASMLTGLVANALGWDRTEGARHQRFQDRLVFAARIDREPSGGARIRDFQTAQLQAGDRSWTTRGVPEGRAGGSNTYDAPHLRYRDYFADMIVTVALRMEPAADAPSLDEIAEALQEPARPLFIGRKPCLAAAPLFAGFSESDTALGALLGWPLADSTRSGAEQRRDGGGEVRVLWPASDSPDAVNSVHRYMLTDQRNWGSSGLHGGGRPVCEGTIRRAAFPMAAAASPQAL